MSTTAVPRACMGEFWWIPLLWFEQWLHPLRCTGDPGEWTVCCHLLQWSALVHLQTSYEALGTLHWSGWEAGMQSILCCRAWSFPEGSKHWAESKFSCLPPVCYMDVIIQSFSLCTGDSEENVSTTEMLFFPTRKVQEEQVVGATYCKKIDSLLQQADFVMLVVSLTPQTHNLIGKRELELMKPTATLINISRGTNPDPLAGLTAWSSSCCVHAALGCLQHSQGTDRGWSGMAEIPPSPLPFSLCSLLFTCEVHSETLLFHTRCSGWPGGAGGSSAGWCDPGRGFGCHLPRTTAQVVISAYFSGRMGEPCWARGNNPSSRQEAAPPASSMSLVKSAMNTDGMRLRCWDW